ncbi:uncharacterized protein PAN0_018d5617 [Moesziomyces antarcticus]|uniref:Cation efflux protein transmembrane domain-containing protein n=2 Tax=Pseudozyma antarctica TaxID=84753 RepID=A0A081CL44_PSEA2|nr:uncharacterized protein PAN0_018d5617 [Moesziomyces antarcticus]GAK67390.1 conserved hypothetical protein [Moesziomyces antarcticus]SPO48641.1 uncharacterized protein PSANT_06332 [Moesziomyces antarcticus]
MPSSSPRSTAPHAHDAPLDITIAPAPEPAAADCVLAPSRNANVSTPRPPSSPQKHLSTLAPDVSQDGKPPASLTHKRSVKHITKQYEQRADTSPALLRPPSSVSRPASPTLKKRSSFLLPSNSDPTTLSATPPRPRSLSSGAASATTTFSRSPSIRLASGSYPSTLRPPVQKKRSSSSIRSLPEPPRPSSRSSLSRPPSAADSHDPSCVDSPIESSTAIVISPVTADSPVEPQHTEPQLIEPELAPQESNMSSVSDPATTESTPERPLAAPMGDETPDADTSNEVDDALYEELDSVADLDTSQPNGAPTSVRKVDFAKMTVAERREHSRRHSRVHSRNLSVFFPRPGTDAEAEADEARARDAFAHEMPHTAPPSTFAISAATASTPAHTPASHVHRRNGSGNRPQITVSTDATTLSPRSASFAALTANQQPAAGKLDAPSQLGDLSPSPTKSRRGHHHRHSVAMLDSGLSPITAKHNGHAMERSTSSTSWTSDTSIAAAEKHLDAHSHHAHSHDHSHHHGHSHIHAHGKRSLHARTVSALSHIPQASRPLLLFGMSHFGLGAALWMAGQEVDSLSATGLGYLVVFDAMGILSSAMADWALEWEQHAADLRRRTGKADGTAIRRPYGMHRVSTLLHFVQTIYLLFASVYVLKESVEHALLEGGGGHAVEGAVDSASGHDHSHAHAEHSYGIVMPNLLLALSLAACVISNLVMGNHARLVAACGISTAASGSAPPSAARHGRSGSVLMRPSELASPLLALLANPFSLTVLFFSSALLFAGLTMPSVQVAALDKVLAGLESVSMFYVAYPASVALGKVLLQTAPSEASPNLQQLKRALKTVEQHPLVSYVPPPNVWQLTPPTSAVVQADRASGVLSGGAGSGRGMHFGSKSASLVASVTVFLKPDASEDDCFEMTKWAWERLAPSVAATRGLMAGEMLRGTQRAGELTVTVKREGHEDDGVVHNAACAHGHEHHGHDHHGHDHHDHGHAHGHAYGHAHSHGHHHHHHH